MSRHIKVTELRHTNGPRGLKVFPERRLPDVPVGPHLSGWSATPEEVATATARLLRDNGFVFHGDAVSPAFPYFTWETCDAAAGCRLQTRASLVGFSDEELALVHDGMLSGTNSEEGE